MWAGKEAETKSLVNKMLTMRTWAPLPKTDDSWTLGFIVTKREIGLVSKTWGLQNQLAAELVSWATSSRSLLKAILEGSAWHHAEHRVRFKFKDLGALC